MFVFHLPERRQKSAAELDTARLLKTLLIRYSRQPLSTSTPTQPGFTLIECLVAIMVIAITMVAITPPIFFATATRAQSRRAEQALQVAQAEVDRVRTAVERGAYGVNDLPVVVSNITTAAAPTSLYSGLRSSNPDHNKYDGAIVPADKVLPVDIDGDNKSDFLVQSFRTDGPPTGSITGFRMGVRVYLDNPILRQNFSSLDTKPASLKLTSGGLGQTNRRPLAVLYSTIARNDTSNSLSNYSTICPTKGSC